MQVCPTSSLFGHPFMSRTCHRRPKWLRTQACAGYDRTYEGPEITLEYCTDLQGFVSRMQCLIFCPHPIRLIRWLSIIKVLSRNPILFLNLMSMEHNVLQSCVKPFLLSFENHFQNVPLPNPKMHYCTIFQPAIPETWQKCFTPLCKTPANGSATFQTLLLLCT